MMKTRRSLKKVLALVLCVVMFAMLLPTFAFADLATPKMSGATASGTGINVTWNTVSGAAGYRIYRKSGSANWGFLKDVGAVGSYLDTSASAGTTYTYTVRALNSGGAIVSGYDAVGVSGSWTKATAGYVATPKPTSATAASTGILVKWDKVSGASGYRLYRKTASTGWAFLADVGDVAEYTDTSAASGVKYTYTVRALNGSGAIISDYNTSGVTGSWTSDPLPGNLPTPKLKSATAQGSGVLVTWDAVSGAAGYKVYRKTASSGWTGLGNTNTNSYLDNTASANVTYTYTVRCLNSGGGVISGFDDKGVSGSWVSGATGTLPAPVMKADVPRADGVEVHWNKVSGANGYSIYRRIDSGAWVWLANVGDVDTYKDTTAVSNTKYSYTVRCRVSGVLKSGYDASGASIHFFATPVFGSAEAVNNGILVKWNAVSGAPLYLLYRKVGASGTWARLDTTTATSYTDKTADAATEYYYTVRVVASDGKTVLSDYDHTGVSNAYLGRAAVTSLTNRVGGVEIKWGSVPGMSSYVVYRKFGTGTWEAVATVSAPTTTYTDSKAYSGIAYTYTVRGKDSGGAWAGTYDEVGKTITFYATPKLVDAVRTGTGIKVTWEDVEGVSLYKIYRKIGGVDTSWVDLGNVTGTSYMDLDVVSGVDVTYTVRCVNSNGDFLSDYDHTGVVCEESQTFFDTPLLTGAKSDAEGIKITWQAVDKVSDYRIYRKDSSGTEWVFLADVIGATEYVDKDVDHSGTVKKGGRYSYTVSCLDDTGKEASEYNKTGLSCTYYPMPVMVSAKNELTNGVVVTWKAVEGVGTYRIYRKTGSGTWTALANVKTNSYQDNTAKSGTTYSYPQ